MSIGEVNVPSELDELFPLETVESELDKLFPLAEYAPELEPSPLEDFWEGVKRTPQLYLDALKKAGEFIADPSQPLVNFNRWGDAWTWIVRNLMSEPDLEDWKDQSPGRQLWTGTRAGALAGGVITAVAGGKSIVDTFRKYYQTTEKQVAWKYEFGVKPPKYIYDKAGRLIEMRGIRPSPKGPAGEWRVPKVSFRVPKAILDLGKEETVFRDSFTKFFQPRAGVVQTISKSSYQQVLYKHLEGVFKQAKIPNVPSAEVLPKVSEAINEALLELPLQLSSTQVANVAKEVFTNLLPLKIAELSSQYAPKPFKTITNLDHLSTFLDNAGLDTKSKNLIYQAVRKGRGVVDDITIQAIADDSIRREIADKPHLYPGELDAYVAYRKTLAEELRGAVDNWRVLGEKKVDTISIEEPSLLQAERVKLMLRETRELAHKHRLSGTSVSHITKMFTGKTDIRKLSEDEFEIVKGAMREWGVLFDKEVQQLDLLEKKYRGAGPWAYGLPAQRVFDLIGARHIHDKVERPYIMMAVERRVLYNNLKDWWKVVKGKGVEGKVFRFLNNTLLPNETLSPQELIVAQKMREITDNLADRMELSPEKRRENYIYNMFDAIARKEIKGKHPIPPEAQDAFRYGVPTKVFTPTLLERLGRKKDLVEDAWKAMRALIAFDLRYIYLDPVFKEVAPEINAWPNETARTYMQDWMEYAVSKRHTPIDDRLNDIINPFNEFITKATKGKVSFGANPMRTLGLLYTKGGYGAVMAFNAAVAIKNMTQQLLIDPLNRSPLTYPRAWMRFATSQGKELLKESLTLTERFPMESFDPHQIGTWLQKGMAFYRLVDYVNVSIAFLSGYDEATKYLGYSHDMAVKYADRLAMISQYSYRPIDMPEFMWKGGAPGRIAGMLQTWQINYFFNYLPELTYRLVTGKDTDGNPVSKYQQAGLLRHLIITGTFVYIMRKYAKVDFKRIFGPGVMNTQLGPSINLLLGLGAAAVGTAGGDYNLKKWGLKQVGKVFPTMFVPAGLQVKKIGRAYQEAAEGLKRDKYGRPVMDVALDTTFKSIFGQPAAVTQYWDAQQKVWELQDKIRTLQREGQAAHMQRDVKGEDKIRDRLAKLNTELSKWQQDLARIRQGEVPSFDKGTLKELERIFLP